LTLPTSEIERLRRTLARLLPYLERENIALTGGVAIELTLAASDLSGHRRTIPDLDFVATSLAAVDSMLTDSFLVCHYHTPQSTYAKFLLMMVDPATRLRIDIFPDSMGAIAEARYTTIGDQTILMLGPRSLLDHKRRTLSKATAADPVDEKHLRDAMALAGLCASAVEPVPATHLSKDVYSTDLDARCARCDFSLDPAYPLAPKRAIFDLLGYV
jgi:hypothetical protein